MQRAQTLIDKAAKVCGSFYALSKVTGIPQSNMTNVMHGKRKMPMEWVPLMADIAGANVQVELALILAEQLPQESKARRVLEKVQATGAAAMLLLCIIVAGLATPGQALSASITVINLTTYTLWNVRKILDALRMRLIGCFLSSTWLDLNTTKVHRWFSLRHMAQAPYGTGAARIGPVYQ